MNSLLILFPTLFIVLLSFAAMAFLAVWTYRDAKARGLNAVLWLLVVLLVPSMIGLIIYLAVGRNQSVALCANCGAGLSADDQFCRKCGAAKADGDHAGPRPIPKGGNRGSLIGFFVCLGLTLLMVVVLIASVALAPFGVYHSFRNFNYVQQETVPAPVQDEAQRIIDGLESQNVSVGVIESNLGNQWNIRFAMLSGQRSKEFTFQQNQQLNVDSKFTSGSIQLIVTSPDGEKNVSYELGNGSQNFTLEDFQPGTVKVTLVCEAKDGSISVLVK